MPQALAAAGPYIASGVGALGKGLAAVGGGSKLGGLLSLGSAGASLFGGGGGGGGDDPKLRVANPSAYPLADLFGMRITPSGIARSKKRPGLFGLRSEKLLEATNDYLYNPIGLSPGEEASRAALLGDGNMISRLLGPGPGGIQDDLDLTMSGLDRLLETNQNLIDTGFRTDATPAFEEALRRFKTNVLPGIAERIGGDYGLSSSAFVDTAGREGANLLGEAAIRQLELDEAAAGRRAGALPFHNTLLNTRLAIQPALANDLLGLGAGQLGLGQQYRSILEEQRSRPLATFMQLSGLPSPTYIQQGFNPAGSGTADVLGAAAGALPNLLKNLPIGKAPVNV